MSTFNYFFGWIGNGFIKNWWGYYKANDYKRSKISPANRKTFVRYCGRHKRIGATWGIAHKQFDPRPFKIYLKFNGRNSIPYDFQMNWGTFHFRFGKKRNKFFY